MENIEKDKAALYITSVVILGLNIGISEIVSIPTVGMIALIAATTPRINHLFALKYLTSILACIFLSLVVFVYTYEIYADTHSGLMQFRELFYLLLIAIYSYQHQKKDVLIYKGYSFSAKIISIIVIIQFIQIKTGSYVLLVPDNFMMLDYGNSLQKAISDGWDYLRPSGLYSEPSVISCTILPFLYFQIKEKNIYWTSICATAIILSGSMYGLIGLMIITAKHIDFNRKNIYKTIPIISALILYASNSDRVQSIISGQDFSLIWRFIYPVIATKSLIDIDIWPKPVSLLFNYQDIYFTGASIYDTWPLFTIARLGFSGLIWIALCFYIIPQNNKFYFLLLSLASGAPLYQDKAILLIIIIRANKYIKYKSEASENTLTIALENKLTSVEPRHDQRQDNLRPPG